MNNNNCISYLEILIPRFKGEIDAALAREERAPPRSREMWIECTKRLNTITAACQQGMMTMEDYKSALEA